MVEISTYVQGAGEDEHIGYNRLYGGHGNVIVADGVEYRHPIRQSSLYAKARLSCPGEEYPLASGYFGEGFRYPFGITVSTKVDAASYYLQGIRRTRPHRRQVKIGR